MLELESIDLGALCEALEDHAGDREWWLDPRTGEVELLDGEEDDPEARGLIPIEPIPSREGYADMADFVARVRDPRARDLLERALGGRGAFRRFKDTLFELPELRAAWFGFHDTRAQRRALRWLADEGVVDQATVELALRERPDPDLPGPSGPFDAHKIARAAATELRGLYGPRLRRVLLFGSWARGDAHPESDIDLLVVLDEVDSPWEELRRMAEILDRHSLENDTVVTALVVAAADFEKPVWPTLIRAEAEGRPVG